MTRTIERANYKVTFAVLLLGVSSYALLQSLVTPVLPDHPARPAHHPEHGDLGPDRLPAVGLDLHAHPRAGSATWWARSGCWWSPSPPWPSGRCSPGWPTRSPCSSSPGPSRASAAPSSPSPSASSGTSSPGPRWPPGVGVIAAMAAVGGGAGIVLAGPIVSHLDYHWLFWIPLVITADRRGLRAPVRPRVAGPDPGPDQLAGRRAPVGLAGGPPRSGSARPRPGDGARPGSSG